MRTKHPWLSLLHIRMAAGRISLTFTATYVELFLTLLTVFAHANLPALFSSKK